MTNNIITSPIEFTTEEVEDNGLVELKIVVQHWQPMATEPQQEHNVQYIPLYICPYITRVDIR